VLRRGALQLLHDAIEAEVETYVAPRVHLTDDHGRRQVVRNGYAAQRRVLTGLGPLAVRMPRVHDRRPQAERERFTSAILPPYLRKAKCIDELIPWLYLKGVSTGDFTEALQALLGPDYQASAPAPSRGCSSSGSTSTAGGRSVIYRTSTTSTSGRTASTSTSAWRRIASAFSC
jgi:transposase-like protein